MDHRVKKIIAGGVYAVLALGIVFLGAPLSAFAQTASVTIGGVTPVATLALSPVSGAHATNDIFSVNIMLDTHGAAAQGVDIISLRYDSALLQAQDEDSSVSGVQIAPGTLMANTVFNSVDSAASTITFSQVTNSGVSFTGSGVLATVRFKALAAGNASVTFDFTLGNTADTNVAGNGSDILASVTNATYTISGTIVPQQPQDTTPPVRSNGTPAGALSAGVTQTVISLFTNESATCKYGTAAAAYASMANIFSTTGGVSHSAVVSGLSSGSLYTYYIRCADSAGNVNINDYTIAFSVASQTQTPTPTPAPTPTPVVPTQSPVPTPTSGGSYTPPVTTVPSATPSSAPTSSHLPTSVVEGDLVRGPDGIKVYIVNHYGYKRHIFNPAVFSMYGHFKWNAIKSLNQQEIDALKTSDLYRADGDARVFALHEVDESKGLAQKRWLSVSAEKFTALGYAWDQVFVINTKERDYYQEGSPITDSTSAQVSSSPLAAGALVKTATDPTVYYITNTGLKKRIVNAAVFNSYSTNKWENIKTVDQSALDAYPTVNTIKLSGSAKVYMLENNTKRWVKTAEAFQRSGLDWGKVTTVNQTEFNAYAEGAPIE